jgi:hypothetical protein
MRRSLKALLTVALALGLTTIALGQRQGGGMFGPGGMLMAPAVQKELKLTDDQISKLKDALGKVREDHKGDFEKIRDMSAEERQKLMRSIGEETQKAIDGVLDAKQKKRFQQLQWQASGPDALGDPKLQKELKLSDEQKKKVATILEDSAKKRRELFQGGFNETTMEKMQALRKDAEEQANKVLTEEQRKTLKELKGETFNFPRPGGGRNRDKG